jgi:hypothetical protein
LIFALLEMFGPIRLKFAISNFPITDVEILSTYLRPGVLSGHLTSITYLGLGLSRLQSVCIGPFWIPLRTISHKVSSFPTIVTSFASGGGN